MRNRAKCKLCDSVIESLSVNDMISCKCGEIDIWGGEDNFKCAAKNFQNFLRVDDENNEIIVQVKGAIEYSSSKPNKKELLEMLDNMIKTYEALPPHAMQAPINHYDFASSLILLSSLFKADLDF